jgi:hypothetical protein
MIDKTKNKKTRNKVVTFILIIGSLAALYFLIIAPVVKNIEQDRFDKLSNNMQNLLVRMQSIAVDSEKLSYEEKCEKQLSGDWPTGKYYCKTIINLEKSVYSASEMEAVKDRYLSMIDSAPYLDAVNEMNISPSESFGKDFVVSSAEKRYANDDGFICDFSVNLYKDDGSYTIYKSGDIINSDEGLFALNIICSNLSNHDWYTN